MTLAHRSVPAPTVVLGVLAGSVGGAAEIAWIIAVAAVTGLSAANVAGGVSASVGIDWLPSTTAMVVGVAIHMGLAIALGIAVAVGCDILARRRSRFFQPYAIVPMALIGVWAINFLVVLPLINPAFVQLVPYPVSFLSKLLFGLAAAEVLRRGARDNYR